MQRSRALGASLDVENVTTPELSNSEDTKLGIKT